jgi:polyferredoxin
VKWAKVLSSAEPDREMKATIVLAVLALLVLVAFAAAPVALASASTMAAGHSTRADELVWMLVSGATLLGVASAVRRYVP